jgi:hypothetical protein
VTYDVFEQQWQRSPVVDDGTIHTLVVRSADGVHDRPAAITLHEECGVIGDRWLRHATRTIESQVTLIERRVAAVLTGARDRWHVPGDNLVVDLDLSAAALPIGARLAAGDAVLEITAKPHAGCDKFRARLGDHALRWVNDRTRRDRRLRGVHARVLVGGTLRLRDRLVRTA